MFNFLKKVFGTKQDRDVKEYNPKIQLILNYQQEYSNLSNDDLRNKTLEFRSRIKEYLAPIDAKIDQLREQAEAEPDIHTKEDIFKIKLLKPHNDMDKQFNVTIKAWDDQIENLHSRIKNLKKTRDLLLPRLMSGQLDVSGIRLPDEVAACVLKASIWTANRCVPSPARRSTGANWRRTVWLSPMPWAGAC